MALSPFTNQQLPLETQLLIISQTLSIKKQEFKETLRLGKDVEAARNCFADSMKEFANNRQQIGEQIKKERPQLLEFVVHLDAKVHRFISKEKYQWLRDRLNLPPIDRANKPQPRGPVHNTVQPRSWGLIPSVNRLPSATIAIPGSKLPTVETIQVMIELLKQDRSEEAKKICLKLPAQIQGGIYGTHWTVCGKPTKESADQTLRNMAHDNFGGVSFLGEESRCHVPNSKKIETLENYAGQLDGILIGLKASIDQTKQEWKNIDSTDKSTMPGPVKNTEKKVSFDKLMKHILHTFHGDQLQVNVITNPQEGIKGYANTYVGLFPCLEPFCLQLIPDFNAPKEKLENALSIDPNTPKSSQVQNLNLAALPDFGKDYRKNIMHETLETLQRGFYVNDKGEEIRFHLRPAVKSLTGTEFLQGKQGKDNGYATKLFLDQRDCLTVAGECAARGLDPIVLDAASDNKFGGGYKTGAAAQEENICRRSGLCMAVDPTQGLQKNNLYPLSGHGADYGLYVAHVPVFRGEEQHGYPYLNQPFEVAVAIMAACNLEEWHQNRLSPNERASLERNQANELRLPEKQAKETEGKLRSVLQMAQEKGHRSVVLMALGCGAFANPPNHVSEIMMKLITEEFPNSFEEIHISIIDDHNTRKAHNPRGNYVPFKEATEAFSGVMQQKGMTVHYT